MKLESQGVIICYFTVLCIESEYALRFLSASRYIARARWRMMSHMRWRRELRMLEIVSNSIIFNANGSTFWGATKRAEGVEEEFDLIVSFDLAMEVFTLIPYPDLTGNSTSDLTVYEDKLCILSLSKIGDFRNYSYFHIDLWVLEEGIGSSTER
ncbi:hypothetical protein K1719_001621 [Acacia pycnantha]|nr:hypothetical protein K1719_001621 [Acacia pycnantha]